MGCIGKILPPQPHYLSGYAGYVPGYKFHYGQSYGKLTHGLFYDKTIKRSNVPVLNDLTNKYDDTSYSLKEKDAINNRCKTRSCKYTTDIIPGYAGYVPQYNFLCGNKYALLTVYKLDYCILILTIYFSNYKERSLFSLK